MCTRSNLIASTSTIELLAREMREAIVIVRSPYNRERLVRPSRFSDAPASLGTATPYRATAYPWPGSAALPGCVNRVQHKANSSCLPLPVVLPFCQSSGRSPSAPRGP